MESKVNLPAPLRNGQTLALDVMNEYVVFLKAEGGGLGYGL